MMKMITGCPLLAKIIAQLLPTRPEPTMLIFCWEVIFFFSKMFFFLELSCELPDVEWRVSKWNCFHFNLFLVFSLIFFSFSLMSFLKSCFVFVELWHWNRHPFHYETAEQRWKLTQPARFLVWFEKKNLGKD